MAVNVEFLPFLILVFRCHGPTTRASDNTGLNVFAIKTEENIGKYAGLEGDSTVVIAMEFEGFPRSYILNGLNGAIVLISAVVRDSGAVKRDIGAE